MEDASDGLFFAVVEAAAAATVGDMNY